MHSALNTLNLLAMYHQGDDGHNISVSLPYLMGFVVVIVTLTVLMGLCMLIGSILQKTTKEVSAQKTVKPPAVPKPANTTNDTISPEILLVLAAAAAASEEPSEEIVTVIAAAVASTFEKPHKILKIKPLTPSWSHAGRQEVLSSHRVG